MQKGILIIGLIFVGTLFKAVAQTDVWQWSVLVNNHSAQPQNKESRAYLWIPEQCRRVSAVIVTQHNMEEISILEDVEFRRRMTKLNVAQVWVCPSFNHGFDFTDGAWETLDELLNNLAITSGYTEIASAPLIGIGHSAAASFPYYLAAYKPERTLACISVSGQWPYVRDQWLNRDIWGNRTIDRIPCLETMGEYESAHTWSNEGLKQRSDHPLLPLSMLACPAEGHFAYSPQKAEYIALYIKKALKYRHTDPTQNGWLAERWHKNKLPNTQPAHINKYKGKKEEAFWFFDREMAQATTHYQSRYRNMKPQLVGVKQNGSVVQQRDSHLQVHPRFITDPDGITIPLTPCFLDTVTGDSPRLSKWTDLPVGSPIGHAHTAQPIRLNMISGPAKTVPTKGLRIAWNRGTLWSAKKAEVVFSIEHPGNEEYKPAVQQAQITIPVRLSDGSAQSISFAPINNIAVGTKTIELTAHSSSALPVDFYIEEGPARIEGTKIILTRIPPRAKFPIKVTVVAWQYGRNTAPKVQTAEPVRQEFYITK